MNVTRCVCLFLFFFLCIIRFLYKVFLSGGNFIIIYISTIFTLKLNVGTSKKDNVSFLILKY